MALSNLCDLVHFHPPRKKFAVIRASTSETINLKSSPLCSLKIGIIGFGSLGQFVAKAIQRQGQNVVATSRADYSDYCQEHGMEFFRYLNGLCETQPDILLLCNSILSTEDVVRRIPFHKLKTDTIIADMLPVKQFPKDLFMEVIPPGFGILCTHPMIGELTGDWKGLRFVYEKVRIVENSIQGRNCMRLLNIFQEEGCRMIEMACEEHDQYIAESQFIAHTVARILSNMNLVSTPLDTKAYETCRELSQDTVNHSSDLYDGLFLCNGNSIKQIEKIEKALHMVKTHLFNKLRDGYRRQVEETAARENKGSIQSHQKHNQQPS